MRSKTITLDGQEIEIQERRSRENSEWRKRWLGQSYTIANCQAALTDYAPQLAEPLQNAYDSEIVDAFKEVLELGNPLAEVVFPGPTAPQT